MGRPRILVNALAVREGGSVSYLINLLREIRRDDRGFDFHFLAAADALRDLDWQGQSVDFVSFPPGALRLPARILYEQIAVPIRARRFDLLYCLADQSPVWGSTPVVVLMRNLNIYDRRYYDGVRTRALARLVAASARRARMNVFPSEAAARQIRAAVPGIRPERTRVVHYGIDLGAFEGGGAPVESDAPYAFLAAAPERHKGIHTLIAALARQPDRSLEVWIAGDSSLDPDYLGELVALAEREGVGERVRFLGRVPYAELLTYYRGARVMVFPSLLESFGHPVLEAMAAEVPIVASDIPAFRELANDVALFFAPGDADGLVAALAALAGDPEAAGARVARGREVAARDFTWRGSIDAIGRVFREALD